MSLYPPPTSNVPIFNPNLFSNAVIGTNSGGIGTSSYLAFPVAQGTETWTDGTFTATLGNDGLALSVINDAVLQGVALNGDGFAYDNGSTINTITWENLTTKVEAVGALSSAYNSTTLNVNNTISIQNGETTGPPTSFIALTSADDFLRLELAQDGDPTNPANFGTAGQVLTSGGASGSMTWTTVGGTQGLPDVLSVDNIAEGPIILSQYPPSTDPSTTNINSINYGSISITKENATLDPTLPPYCGVNINAFDLAINGGLIFYQGGQIDLTGANDASGYGTAGQVLTSGGTEGFVYWSSGGGSQNLQEVLDTGNKSTTTLQIYDNQPSTGPLGYQNITKISDNLIQVVSQDATDADFQNQTQIGPSSISITNYDYDGENSYMAVMNGNSSTGFVSQKNLNVGLGLTLQSSLSPTSLAYVSTETSVFSSNTEYNNNGFNINPQSANPNIVNIIASTNDTACNLVLSTFEENAQITGGFTSNTTIGDSNTQSTTFITNTYDNAGLAYEATTIAIDPKKNDLGGVSVLHQTFVGSVEPPFLVNQKGVLSADQLELVNLYTPPEGPIYQAKILIQPSTTTQNPTTADDGGLIDIWDTKDSEVLGRVRLTPYQLRFYQNNYIGSGDPFGLTMQAQYNYNGANGIYGLQSIDLTNQDTTGSTSLGGKGMNIQSGGSNHIQWVYPNDYTVASYTNILGIPEPPYLPYTILDLPYNKPPTVFCSYYDTTVDANIQLIYTNKIETLVIDNSQTVSLQQSGNHIDNQAMFICQPNINNYITANDSNIEGYSFFYGDDDAITGFIPYTPWGQSLDNLPSCILTYQSPKNIQNALQLTAQSPKQISWKSSAPIPIGSKVQLMFSSNPLNSGYEPVLDGTQSGTIDITSKGPFNDPVILITLLNDEEFDTHNITPIMITSITSTDFSWKASAPIVVDNYASLFYIIYEQSQI